ncbi:Ankyrin repeat-containing domain-containing protein [Burkholderia sp. lig30]|jgi:ankyrin repeat protein|uniref:ankyrin repeat domain-containing protein n=1 Tax=Burkholderia sp. lig30 TaxID=1192124 RepID=UPI000460B50F|nr:ankyrin repeat domain-containing protein [Burkholderia sp. lig30]KDB06762.1 Ankyrin repeat-containing domain-containing protein [Burkholderia sp. lig30]
MTKPTNHLSKRAMLAALLIAGGVFTAAGAHAESVDKIVKAVKFDDIADIGKQLKNGLDPNTTDAKGDPLLVIAAREKSDKVAAALASTPSVDLEKEDKAGENALMLASLNGDVGLVKLLIDKGAEVNKKGWAPLHYAATNGQDEAAKVLLDHAAYVDTASPNGTTPLMMAARGNHPTTVNLLLDQGADPAVKNQLGLTALDFAKHYKAPDATEILSKRTVRVGASAPADAQKSAK